MNTYFKLFVALVFAAFYTLLVGCATHPSCNPDRQETARTFAKEGAKGGKIGGYNESAYASSPGGCYFRAHGSSMSRFRNGEELDAPPPQPPVVIQQQPMALQQSSQTAQPIIVQQPAQVAPVVVQPPVATGVPYYGPAYVPPVRYRQQYFPGQYRQGYYPGQYQGYRPGQHSQWGYGAQVGIGFRYQYP